MKTNSLRGINFFKVNSAKLTGQVGDNIKNQLENRDNSIVDLEEELKKETAKSRGINVEQIPSDVLLGERINAKLFQFKLKKQGVDISLWEVFTLFEQLNIEQARVFTEP